MKDQVFGSLMGALIVAIAMALILCLGGAVVLVSNPHLALATGEWKMIAVLIGCFAVIGAIAGWRNPP